MIAWDPTYRSSSTTTSIADAGGASAMTSHRATRARRITSPYGEMGPLRRPNESPVDKSAHHGLGCVDAADGVRDEVSDLVLLDQEAVVTVGRLQDVETVGARGCCDEVLL